MLNASCARVSPCSLTLLCHAESIIANPQQLSAKPPRSPANRNICRNPRPSSFPFPSTPTKEGILWFFPQNPNQRCTPPNKATTPTSKGDTNKEGNTNKGGHPPLQNQNETACLEVDVDHGAVFQDVPHHGRQQGAEIARDLGEVSRDPQRIAEVAEVPGFPTFEKREGIGKR